MTDRIYFVVSLWITGDVAGFEAYERAAAQIMSRHDGRMETVVRCSADDGAPFEVHVVSFPSVASFEKYRSDPQLAELRSLRERVIERTVIWQGRGRQAYDTSPSNA